MDSDQQYQKGLFTFYRQQADLQDELKSRKNHLKESKSQKMEQTQKKPLNPAHKSKSGHSSHKKNGQSFSYNKDRYQDMDRLIEDNKKQSDSKDKLISILRKYNAKQIKRRDHLRVIMQIQEQPSLDQTQELKNRLERLLSDEENSYFNILQSEKIINKSIQKQQYFVKKKQQVKKINPFKKLAIIPTNFSAELQQQKNMQLPFKKVQSPPKSLAYSLEVRKNDKIQIALQEKQRLGIKQNSSQSNPLKLNLPKIEMRSNSEMLNNSKIRPIKLGEKYYFDPINSQRFRSKPQHSIYLDSIKLHSQIKNAKHPQNKIYSLFIQDKVHKSNQLMNSFDKEIRLADVVRRMKFS